MKKASDSFEFEAFSVFYISKVEVLGAISCYTLVSFIFSKEKK